MSKITKHSTLSKIVIASHNKGKLREIDDLLRPYGIETVSAGELGLPEPEETETTFAGNARLKALASARASGLPALSDDSGLAVDGLNGDPGIYAARWAEKPSCEGGGRDFDMAMWHVHDKMIGLAATPIAARALSARFVWPFLMAKLTSLKAQLKAILSGRRAGIKALAMTPSFKLWATQKPSPKLRRRPNMPKATAPTLLPSS